MRSLDLRGMRSLLSFHLDSSLDSRWVRFVALLTQLWSPLADSECAANIASPSHIKNRTVLNVYDKNGMSTRISELSEAPEQDGF